MKNQFHMVFRIFLRCKYLFVTYVTVTVLWFLFLVLNLKSELYINELVRYIPFFIGLFLFIGYELFVRVRDVKLWETLDAHPQGAWRLFSAQTLFGGALAIGFSLICALLTILSWVFIGSGYAALLQHTLLLCVLYLFLVPLASFLLGQMLAVVCRQRRFLVYFIAVLLMLASTNFAERLASFPQSEFLSTILFNVLDFFTLGPKAVTYVIDLMYGMPMEPYKWCIAIFWCCFALLISYIVVRKRHMKRWGAGLLAVVCLISASGFALRGSVMTMDDRLLGQKYDNIHYYDYYNANPESVELPDPGFHITAYDMKIKIWNQVSATVTLDVTGLPEEYDWYTFTLYHRMKVTKVLDENGKQLAFERTEDQLLIPAYNGDATRFTVVYHGFSPQHFSNVQCVYLPGNFPYYPMEGNKRVGVMNDYAMDTSISDTVKSFNVQITSPLNIFCNLEGENNAFSGSSKSLSLIGGMLDTLDADNRVFGSPLLDTFDTKGSIEELRSLTQRINTIMDGRITLPDVQDSNIFYLPHKALWLGTADEFLFLEDHMITRSLTYSPSMVQAILDQQVPPVQNVMFIRNFLINALSNIGEETYEGYYNAFSDDWTNWVSLINSYIEGGSMDSQMVGSAVLSLIFLRDDGEKYLFRLYDAVIEDSLESEILFVRQLLLEVLENDTNS